MKLIDFFIFLLFFITCIAQTAYEIKVSLEKTKETKKLRGKSLYHSIIINDSQVIYESYERGVHLIQMNEHFNILKPNVFLINNATNCSMSLLSSIKNLKNSFFLIFSVDNWEICLDDLLISELNVSSLSYLKTGKRGLGHAFVYFFDGQNFVLNISHESYFTGKFLVDIHHYDHNKFESFNDKTDENTMNIPFNNSSFFIAKSELEKNAYSSKNDFFQRKIMSAGAIDHLEYSLKENLSLINSDIQNNEKDKDNNNSEKEIILTQKIELVSFGSNYSSNDFSSIKINGRLAHASHSCGIHVVAYDPCINETNFQRKEAKRQKIKILELYEKIMKNEETYSGINEIDCDDSLKTLELMGLLEKKGELKLKCPKNCLGKFEESDEKTK